MAGGRYAREDGQGLVEFILVFAVVAAVVAALVLASPNAAEITRDGTSSTICKVLENGDC
jgi:hypothetical protein